MGTTDTQPGRADAERPQSTSDDIVAKLKKSLSKSGDFPTSAKVVAELRALAMNPATTANQIAEIILKEPSLGMRILSLVNSAFYKPTKPITTISQAIIQIGMKPIVEMCSSLILLQKFVPEARKNGAFALCLRRSVLTSLLTSSLASATVNTASKSISQRSTESGFLVGMMAEIGTLMLAFYYPQLYDSAIKRSEQKGQSLSLSIKQLFGLTPLEISSEITSSMGLPQYYADVLRKTDAIANKHPDATAPAEDLNNLSRCLGCAALASDAINGASDPAAVVKALHDAIVQFDVPVDALQQAVSDVGTGLKNHCDAINVALPEVSLNLEEVVLDKTIKAPTRAPTSRPAGAVAAPPTSPPSAQPRAAASTPPPPPQPDEQVEFTDELAKLNKYVLDVRAAIKANEPTSTVITTVMEACAHCLLFSRVVLLLGNKERSALTGRVALGRVPGFVSGKYVRSLSDPSITNYPDYRAYTLGQTVTTGSSIFPDGHTSAAIPIGLGRRTVGVIYLERTGGAGVPKELSLQEQSALVMLASLLDKAANRSR
jgi:HD-like signal output (HDOD) protein